MKVTRREIVYEGNYLRVISKTSVASDEKEVIWETVERTNVYGKGAVVVVALTGKGEFILERHWRAPIESFVIQFPAGLTDVPGESNEETARRELLEETGYAAGELVPIISVPASPALSSVTLYYYFAPEVEYTGNSKKDISEELEVITVPKDNLSQFLLDLPDDTKLDLNVAGIVWILAARGLV
jgi:ADP-ribose pyrophosphatase